MTVTKLQMPSPDPSMVDRENSVASFDDKTVVFSNVNMLKIQSLLNPSGPATRSANGVVSHPPTPACTIESSSTFSTPCPDTPTTTTSSQPQRQKLIKDSAVFTRGEAKGRINYRPFECIERAACLTKADREDLQLQHRRFSIFPSGSDEHGLIADYTRHIPYSSDKKSFYGKTGKEGFNVFQYTFKVPNDPDSKMHVVMWDYDNGLVRITPFFKALKYSKTTPAKALTTNPGLKDLSHSITGGALAAQGYWMPYSCARAICLTFCYDIRWALTPIFGPSFIRECIRPDQAGFGRFKIDTEIVRCAQLEAAGSRSTPTSNGGGDVTRHIPRSVPQSVATTGKDLRPRAARPTFKQGSPFESDSDTSNGRGHYTIADQSTATSPQISPKTSTSVFAPPIWSSINSPAHAPPGPPNNTPVGSLSHSHSLLTQPRYASWRPADMTGIETSSSCNTKMPTSAHDNHRVHKRRRSSIKQTRHADAEYVHFKHSGSDGGISESESDDEDIIITPPAKKRVLRRSVGGVCTSAGTSSSVPPKMTTGYKPKSQKYTAQDARAAHWLLNLSLRDSQLAKAPGLASTKKDSGYGY